MAGVATVFATSNYDVFKKLSGNRAILDQRKALIVQSIKERGWIRNPIIVNEKNGDHRWARKI